MIIDHPQTLVLLEQAKTVAAQNSDQRGLAETELRLANVGGNAGKTSVARHHAEKALAIARELGHHQLLARCLNMLAYAYAQARQYDLSVESALEAQQLYATAGNLVLAADSQRIAGWSLIFSGRPQESLLTLQETLAFSQQIENLWGKAECVRMLARTHLELGHYGQAIRMAKQAVKQTRRVGHLYMRVFALLDRGTIQRTIMAWDSAQETLLQALAQSTEQDLTIFINWVLSELCAVHALAGDWGQAYDYAKQVLPDREGESMLPLGLTSWYETEALLRGGDGDLARAEVEHLAETVGNNKRYQLPLLRSQAVLAQWDGEAAQAITHLQAALALAQEIGLPGEQWPILGELGGLYAEWGEEAQAQQTYKAAAAIILRLAETIDEEDLRAGFLAAGPVRSVLEMSEGG